MAKYDLLSKKNPEDKVEILGVKVSSTSESLVLEKIEKICQGEFGRPYFVITVNPEFVMRAQNDDEFRYILNSADLAVPDGVGLKLVKRSLQIIPGRKLVEKLLQNNYRVFFLGGENNVAKRMAKKYGGGYDAGHSDIEKQVANEKINGKIIKKINSFKPDILLVAYGAPWQEKWLHRNRLRLKAKCMIGVGGTFDYLLGDAVMPPIYIERHGLEWLWRLAHQPWRWRRQLNLVRFVWRALISSKF